MSTYHIWIRRLGSGHEHSYLRDVLVSTKLRLVLGEKVAIRAAVGSTWKSEYSFSKDREGLRTKKYFAFV